MSAFPGYTAIAKSNGYLMLKQGVMAAGPVNYFYQKNSDPRLIEQ